MRRVRIGAGLLFAALAAGGSPAMAQGAGGVSVPGEWSFAASAYAWLPALSSTVDTPVGTVNADMSASDTIDSLEFAFMGTFAARRDRWSLIGDLIYSDISVKQDTPFNLYSDATLDTKLTLFSGYALYRVHESDQVAIDLGGGFRVISLDLDLSLNADRAQRDRNFGDSSTWVEPLVAARAIVPLGERWFATAYADFGGTASDERTWQILSSVGYTFNDRWSMQLAYRYLEIQKKIDSLDTTLDLYGPLIGATYHF